MQMYLNNSQLSILHKKQPYLTYDHIKNVIIGLFRVDLRYDPQNEDYISEELKEKRVIKDLFKIEIDLNNLTQCIIPKVREIDGRIVSIAREKKLSYADLHLNNQNGEMCMILPLLIKNKYPNGFDMSIFLNHVEEHLYWISYFDKYGKKPWLDYGHGLLGLYQYHKELGDEVSFLQKALKDCSKSEKKIIIKQIEKNNRLWMSIY